MQDNAAATLPDPIVMHSLVADSLAPLMRQVKQSLVNHREQYASIKSDAQTRVAEITAQARATAKTQEDMDAANKKITALLATVTDAEDRLVEDEAAIVRHLESMAQAALIALGRHVLRAERDRAVSDASRFRAQLPRAQHRQEILKEPVRLLDRTSPEYAAAQSRHRVAADQVETLSDAIDAAEHSWKILQRAWHVLRMQERDIRLVSHGEPLRFCRACEGELDASAIAFCSDPCRRRDNIAIAWGRRCALCARHFESATRRVSIFDSRALDDMPEAYFVAVCSLSCWRALIVDEDDPPVFEPTRYLGAPGATPAARMRHARQQRLAGEVVQEKLNAADVIVVLLTKDGSLTVREIVRRSGLRRPTVQSALERLEIDGTASREAHCWSVK